MPKRVFPGEAEKSIALKFTKKNVLKIDAINGHLIEVGGLRASKSIRSRNSGSAMRSDIVIGEDN